MSYLSQIVCRYFGEICTLFQIISDFLYVCQSAHYLTLLLKLDYHWISSVVDELSFSNFWETFLGCFCTSSNNFRFLVCLSVCLLPHFLTNIMLSSSRGAIFFQIFCRNFWDSCSLVQNSLRLLVCLSVFSLPNSGYLQFWMS